VKKVVRRKFLSKKSFIVTKIGNTQK